MLKAKGILSMFLGLSYGSFWFLNALEMAFKLSNRWTIVMFFSIQCGSFMINKGFNIVIRMLFSLLLWHWEFQKSWTPMSICSSINIHKSAWKKSRQKHFCCWNFLSWEVALGIPFLWLHVHAAYHLKKRKKCKSKKKWL